MLRRTLHCSTTNLPREDVGESDVVPVPCPEDAAGSKIGQVSSFESFTNLRSRLSEGRQSEFSVGTKVVLTSVNAGSESIKVEGALRNDFWGPDKEQ